MNFFILWIDANIAALVFSGFDGQQKKVELDVADLGHLREGHADEGGGQGLGDDELVARVQVITFPLRDVWKK